MKWILLIIVTIAIGCATSEHATFSAHSNQFENKYLNFISPDETIVASWYHYVKTRTNEGYYVVRTFIPESKQITSEIRYRDEHARSASGRAKYWHENGNLKSEGNYKNSFADGIWTFYHRESGKVSSKGGFQMGKKNGAWEVWDKQERLKESLNYKNDLKEGEFIEYDSVGAIINEGIYRADTVYQQTLVDTTDHTLNTGTEEQMPHLSRCKSLEDKQARATCSDKALLNYIYKSLKYPVNARKYGIEGTTVTEFTIDRDGSIKDIDIVIGLCEEFKDMNMEILSNMPKWEPGIQRGEKVKVRFTLPIKYRLE